MSNVHVTEESRSLRCDLTNIERLEKGRALAEADAECARIEEEKAQVATQYAARLKTATSRRHELAGAIRQGYEFREVPCQVQHVYTDREVSVIRLDTGEVIERRGMDPTELREAERRAQGDLFPEEQPQPEPIILAETDPDAQAATAAENEDTEGRETAADATEPAPAAPGAPPDDPAPAVEGAGEVSQPLAATSKEPPEEHQRKPRSDKGKPRGPRKVHELDARDPGFTTQPAGEPPEPPATENEPEMEEAPELPGDGPAPEACEHCGHAENVHGDSGMCGCMVDGCECRKLRLPLDDPDPLHLDGFDPKAERREADDAKA